MLQCGQAAEVRWSLPWDVLILCEAAIAGSTAPRTRTTSYRIYQSALAHDSFLLIAARVHQAAASL